MRFDDCLRVVLGVEGGYVKKDADRGGATNYGVTQATYDEFRRRHALALRHVSAIDTDEVRQIYRDGYWMPIRGDNLPRGMDLVTFDGAVNHGVRQASKFLQRALGVDDDGVIGKATVEAAVRYDLSGMTLTVVADVLGQRSDFYERLVEKNPSQKVFLVGWHNRLQRIAKEIAG